MEVEIKGQKKELREIKYLEAVEVEEIRQKDGLRAATKSYLISSGLTDEEVEDLSIADGLKVQTILNEISSSFQNPIEKQESNQS